LEKKLSVDGRAGRHSDRLYKDNSKETTYALHMA